jgi:hypothetical protein
VTKQKQNYLKLDAHVKRISQLNHEEAGEKLIQKMAQQNWKYKIHEGARDPHEFKNFFKFFAVSF